MVSHRRQMSMKLDEMRRRITKWVNKENFLDNREGTNLHLFSHRSYAGVSSALRVFVLVVDQSLRVAEAQTSAKCRSSGRCIIQPIEFAMIQEGNWNQGPAQGSGFGLIQSLGLGLDISKVLPMIPQLPSARICSCRSDKNKILEYSWGALMCV